MAETVKEKLDASVPIRFWRRFTAAGPTTLAAAVAYNLFFALVPAAFALLAGASFFGRSDDAIAQTRDVLDAIAPAQTSEFISEQLLPDVERTVRDAKGLFIVGTALVALWLASRGIMTMQRVLARIERMQEDRPWWKVRVIALLLTAGVGVALTLSTVLLVAGDAIAGWIAEFTDATWVASLWQAVSLPAGSIGFLLYIVALYRFGPPRRLPGLWMASFIATAGVLGASLGFRFYLDQVGSVGANTLTVFGTFAVLLLWLYLIAYVIIIAAAVGASLSRRLERRRAGSNDETSEISLGLEILESEVAGDVS
ncbi:MAG: YihY/virulence factor BrkB family protein [Acidimicrobiia bacterium]|nr:YihY/virulence factor BrkB family protein [Acidimicrobiia bacterium]